ncbi:hypothetical protein PMI35_02312 [Pseudomonas sp. GM78]|nr:hypothetical protein PMI35_02312 [Pseudomonas sp. GM78]
MDALSRSPRSWYAMILQTSTHALFSYSCPLFSLVPTLMRGHEWKKRARVRLAPKNYPLYRPPVAAKSATDLGGSISRRRISAPITIAGAFFVPASLRYGGLCRSTLGCAGLRLPRSANPMQLATLICLAAERGGSSEVNGATSMTTFIPSKIRALAHRRMALSALRANSSLSVRLKRYNHHMDQVRALKSQGGEQ